MSDFCYVCGKLDHSESECPDAIKAMKEGRKVVREYGAWLRVESANFDQIKPQERGPQLASIQERSSSHSASSSQSNVATNLINKISMVGFMTGNTSPRAVSDPVQRWKHHKTAKD